MPLDERLDALADDEVVVGQEHRDRAGTTRCVIHGSSSHTRRGPEQVGTFPNRVVLGTPRDACHHTRQPGSAGRGWLHEYSRADPPHRSRHLALLDPHRGDRGCPAPGLRLGDHALRPASPDRGHGRRAPAGRGPVPLRQRAAGLHHRGRADGSSTAGTRAAGSWARRWSTSARCGTASRPSSCRTSSASPSGATAGSGSSRPAAAAPASRRRDGCAGARSCSGRPRWCGRRSR